MEIAKQLNQAADRSARKLTSKLRRQAYESGWPTDVTRHLNVVNNDGAFSVDLPDSFEKRILDLELGTQHTYPNPVMRRFMNRISQHMGDFDNEMTGLLDRLRLF